MDETKNTLPKTRNFRTSFGFSNDDIPIMMLNEKDDLWKRQSMSFARKCCLILSVLLCIATIIIFLYVIPCDNSSTICIPVSTKSFVSWDKTLDGVGE